jgi:prevent-host-death family protein
MRRVGSYEAKTHLPRLLDDVAKGESITITKHGIAVARLVPPTTDRRLTSDELIDGFRSFRRRHRLKGVSIRELIDEGRQ